MAGCRGGCPCHVGGGDGGARQSAQDVHDSSGSDISIMTLSPFSPPTSYWNDDLYSDYDSIEEFVIFREDMPDYTQLLRTLRGKGVGGWGIFTDCFWFFKLIFRAKQ
ncbi:hypothetical protein LOK49_LG07G00608 [Camellia lanceoleosa]|uniref:Uncharacterized protein n=1 Tax=Camellia lanceoleosa TaxID=1840588 RepID=A0ACC0H0V9_9ERIC|nr:hypothetical protein LOK49_LG07G00608 [Camellia lanceoleosa]